MSDEQATQNAETQNENGEKGNEQQVDMNQVIERLKTLETQRDAWKKNEQGYQRVVNEQKTKIEELETEKMTERQRAEYEKKKAEDEIRLAREEVAREKRELTRVKLLGELNVPQHCAQLIADVDDAEKLRSAIKDFMDGYQKDVLAGINKKLGESGGEATAQTGDQAQSVKPDKEALNRVLAMPSRTVEERSAKDAAMEKYLASLGSDLMNF